MNIQNFRESNYEYLTKYIPLLTKNYLVKLANKYGHFFQIFCNKIHRNKCEKCRSNISEGTYNVWNRE